jgi:hypothetical protein
MIDHGSGEVDLKKVTSQFYNFIFKHLKKVQVFLICWVALSSIFAFLDRRNLTITYYVSTEYMSGQKIELILEDMKNLIGIGEYKRFSAMIGMPVNEVKKIKSIWISVEDPEYLMSAGGELGPNYYFNETNTQITISLKDSTDVNRLVDRINNYILNSIFFQKVKLNEKVTVSLMNSSLEAQKTELDSMNRLNLNKFINNAGNIIYASDISEIKRNIYTIDEKLIKNNRGIIRLEDPINLLNYPITHKKKISELIFFSGLKSLMFLLPVFFLYFFTLRFRRAFLAYKQTHQA